MQTDDDTQAEEIKMIELEDGYDSLDDASRRKLLARISSLGAAIVPTSILFLDAEKAQANTGSTCELACD